MTVCKALFRETALNYSLPLGINKVCVPLCWQAQSLLRWHDSHQYCSKTGQPTQKNPAGSKRVCHASGVTYYPQVSTWQQRGGTQVIPGASGKKGLGRAGYFIFSGQLNQLRKAKICTYLLCLNFFCFGGAHARCLQW